MADTTGRTAVPGPIPRPTLINDWSPRPDYAEAFRITLPRPVTSGEAADSDRLTRVSRTFFGSFPAWIDPLLSIRNALVRPLGLDTGHNMDRKKDPAAFTASPRGRIGLFQVRGLDSSEIMFGQEDSHLDFRLSLILEDGPAGPGLTAATSVRYHRPLGRWYMAVVAPFHRRLMKTTLTRAGRTLAAGPECNN